MSKKAPPIGVLPKSMWIAHRFWDLANACNRYMEAEQPIPPEWVQEMREHFHVATNRTQADVDVIKWKQWLWPKQVGPTIEATLRGEQ